MPNKSITDLAKDFIEKQQKGPGDDYVASHRKLYLSVEAFDAFVALKKAVEEPVHTVDDKDALIFDMYRSIKMMSEYMIGNVAREVDKVALFALINHPEVKAVVENYQAAMVNAHSTRPELSVVNHLKSEDTKRMLRFAEAAVEWKQKAETLELEKRHMKERLKSVMKEALHALYTGNAQEAMSILEVYSSKEALNDDGNRYVDVSRDIARADALTQRASWKREKK